MKPRATWLFLLSVASLAAAAAGGCASNALERDASSAPVHYGWPEPDTGASQFGVGSES